MYLPRSLPLCDPHLHTWAGDGGRRYDFVISRPVTKWPDEPAVYILVKQEHAKTIPLYIGQTSSVSRWFGPTTARCPEVWRRALAMGMTHVHLRFEACSERARQAEVRDLVAAVAPALNESLKDEPQPLSLSFGASRSVAPGRPDVLVPYRAKTRVASSVRQERDFRVAPEFESAVAPHRPLRADPARDEDPEYDEETVATLASPVEPALELEDESQFDPAPAVVEVEEMIANREPAMAAETEPAILPLSTIGAQSWSPVQAACLAETLAEESRTEPVVVPRSSRLLDRFVRRVVERMACWRTGGGVGKAEAVPLAAAAPAELPADRDAALVHTEQAAAFEMMEPPVNPATIFVDLPMPAPATAASETSPAAAPVAVEELETATPVVIFASATAPVAAEELEVATPVVVSAPAPRAELPVETAEEAKRGLNLNPSAPVVLFAGDMAYEAGADILFDAMVIVCADHQQVQFVFAGDGALRAGLQERANALSLAHRCRFLGDVAAAQFEQVLAACDFVAIPARAKQGEELARFALGHGKPVLITHQSGISGVTHGENGLVTYDNPGSFVWGIRELLGPLYGSLRRHLAEAA